MKHDTDPAGVQFFHERLANHVDASIGIHRHADGHKP
jgi:hypothetical protein